MKVRQRNPNIEIYIFIYGIRKALHTARNHPVWRRGAAFGWPHFIDITFTNDTTEEVLVVRYQGEGSLWSVWRIPTLLDRAAPLLSQQLIVRTSGDFPVRRFRQALLRNSKRRK